MRVVQNPQMKIGEIDIAAIQFDPSSRDDIPKILRGLQHIYIEQPLRRALFELLEVKIAPTVDKNTGRPGMTLWAIFVCGVIRLDLNIDFDRLHDLANHHGNLRAMLGHGLFDTAHYHHQTLKDNVSLFTPELLEEVNELVVNAGHRVAKKKPDEALRGRCDSFVVETHVHFPTDINLLFDALRKVITLTAQWGEAAGLSDGRQHAYNVRQVKRGMRRAQNTKRSKAQSDTQKAKNDARVIAVHQDYLDLAQRHLDKAKDTLKRLQAQSQSELDSARKLEIEKYMAHAARQIDQTKRRVILGETIPHHEKVFSLFEPHTEWISKGKAGVPVELGVKVCVLEDQHRFILHHQVMENQTDDQVAVAMVKAAKAHFPTLAACSFDKGFHSKENQTALLEHLTLVALPRKGKRSKAAQEIEDAADFVKARRTHSAVESAINALEVHGLDVCRDHGIDGFKRYVAWAVVARNIHRMGALLWEQDQERARRDENRRAHAPPLKKAA